MKRNIFMRFCWQQRRCHKESPRCSCCLLPDPESDQNVSVMLENVPDNMSSELLSLLVEDVSELEDSSYSLELMSESRGAVVTFRNPAGRKPPADPHAASRPGSVCGTAPPTTTTTPTLMNPMVFLQIWRRSSLRVRPTGRCRNTDSLLDCWRQRGASEWRVFLRLWMKVKTDQTSVFK